MFNLRSAIKIEDGEILESNPFIKIEREGDAGIAAGIQTVIHSTSRLTYADLTISETGVESKQDQA